MERIARLEDEKRECRNGTGGGEEEEDGDVEMQCMERGVGVREET